MSSGTSRKTLAYAGILIINFMAMFLIASSGTYSYSVASYFGSTGEVGIVFTFESVARCISVPISGTFSEKAGHRRLFLGSLTAYIASFMMAAFAPTFQVFAVARTIAGFTWGLFVTNIFVLISDLFGQDKGPKHSGIAQTLSTAAMIVASPIAGAICTVNWRLFFYISIPVLVAGLIFCFIGIPHIPKHANTQRPIDAGGCIATAVILIPLSLAMCWGSSLGWFSPLILSLAFLSVSGLLSLIAVERKASDPLYPVKLLHNKFYLSIFMVSLFYALGNAVTNYIPTYVQQVLGYNSAIADLVTLPALITATILSVIAGNLAAKHSRYRNITIFWAISACIGGACFFIMTNVTIPLIGLLITVLAALFYGMVTGIQQIVPHTYPMKVLRPDELSSGMAFMGTSGVLGNTIASGIYGAQLTADPTMRSLFFMPFVCAAIMLIFALRFKDVKSSVAL